MQNTKNIKIKDLDIELSFEIRLFNALEGLDFVDKIAGAFNTKDKLSIKSYLSDLLPLATQIDDNGVKIQNMNLDIASKLFRNFLAILELGISIFEFQEVFMQNSKIFQPMAGVLRKSFNMKTTE